MPDWVREGINPSPTLDLTMTEVFGFIYLLRADEESRSFG